MKKNVKLYDIAKAAGYSVNTISHALKDKPDIAVETRNKIKKLAQKMGYIGNDSASFLRSGISKTIAVILGDISNPHFSIMVKEIEQSVRKYGYTIFILNTNENIDDEEKAIQTAVRKNVDGIIICPVQKNHNNIDFLKSTGTPYVLIGRKFNDYDDNYVVCDDINGGFIATEHLISLGHKDILFLNGPEYISSSKERLNGYINAHQENNLHYNNDLIVFGQPQSGSWKEVLANKLAEHKGISAILSFSDMIAWEIISALKELNLRTPEDISVVGFDNIQSKVKFPVFLTTVSSLKTTMAVTASEMLMKEINEDEILNRHVVLDTKLIVRETTTKKLI